MKHDDTKLQLFLKHRRALVEYATPLTGDRARAEDVVQDAFIRFMPLRDGAAAVSRPLGYLYRIVRNLALDLGRRRSNEQAAAAEPAWWLRPDAPRTPEQDLLHGEAVDRVRAALAKLPPDARLAIEMNRFGGYTLQEIAERLQVSVPTAHRLIRDGLVRVADALSDRTG